MSSRIAARARDSTPSRSPATTDARAVVRGLVARRSRVAPCLPRSHAGTALGARLPPSNGRPVPASPGLLCATASEEASTGPVPVADEPLAQWCPALRLRLRLGEHVR